MWDINMVYIYIINGVYIYIYYYCYYYERSPYYMYIYIYPGYIQKMCKYPLISYKLIWLVVYLQ